MKAIVVEGGAMRGIFATGVLDAYIETGFFPYEFAIGVSAGTSNLANYLAFTCFCSLACTLRL